jgi:poly-gamma-glutamate synthesis protein (capsule biosynthesis protein)
MRRPAVRLLLASLSVAWLLASCRPAPTSPAPPAPTAASLATATQVAGPQPSATYTALPRPTPTLSAAQTSTPAKNARPSPSPIPYTPKPTAAPVLGPEAGQPLSLSLDWRLDANGHLTSGLILEAAGRRLFLLGSLGRTVYALTDEGRVAWRLRTSGPVYALAHLDGDQAAAGDDAGNVTAFDAGGRQLWQVALGSRVTALHGGWQGGLLAGGWDERLSFLDGTGELRWQARVDGPLSGIATLPGLALASTLHGQVAAFDATGAEQWRFQAGAPITSLGTAGDGADAMVLLALQDGRLAALTPEGTRRWQQQVSLAESGAPVWQVADLGGDAASEIVAGSGGAEPNLALLSAGGDVRWRRAVPAPVGALATVDIDGDGSAEILAGLASGEVQAYDGQGRLRGSVNAGLQVWGLHAIEDGTALVRADVAAWQVGGGDGPTGGAWLQPPDTIQTLVDELPERLKRKEGEAVLVFLGDVAPGRSMEAQLARYGPAYPWAGLAPLLQEADLVSANLEGVLATQGHPLEKSYLIRAHPSTGETLRQAGFDLVHLANNHALDYGEAALDQTVNTLEALGIAFVGAGSSPEMARRPAEFTVNGLRVAVLGYAAARWNGSPDVPATDLIAWANVEAMQADVRAVRDRADLVIVQLHAGTEYATAPSPDQVRFARAAIDAGANLVVGHHPHVTQTVEQYKGGLIVYSLGDALFDIPRPAAMRGHLLRVHVTRDGLAQAELWPFWIADSIQPRLVNDGQGQAQFRIIYP